MKMFHINQGIKIRGSETGPEPKRPEVDGLSPLPRPSGPLLHFPDLVLLGKPRHYLYTPRTLSVNPRSYYDLPKPVGGTESPDSGIFVDI